MPRLHESGPFQGSYGQPRETTQHLLGPTWAIFRPTKFKFHYVAPQFFIFRRTVQISFIHLFLTPNSRSVFRAGVSLNIHSFIHSFIHSLTCAHISPWLNPTGHSKVHKTSNHHPPATNSGRTARTPLYPPVQAVLPYSLSFSFLVPDRGTGEGRYLCPWQACATTACSECAR